MACVGLVKSFNDGKGWGFIAYEGNDVFVHIKDCQGGKPEAGDQVQFDMDPQKAAAGQYKAVNCIGGTGSLDAAGRKGGGKGAMGTGSCQGTVKSFSQEKGWGFIEMNGTDVFVHFQECNGSSQPVVGDVVSFDVEESPSKPGQMRAKNCSGGSGWDMGKGGGGGANMFGGKGGMGGMWGGKGGYSAMWGAPGWGMPAGPYGGGGCWGGKGGW
mmetsp:Transcript_82027/g.235662  ORF Transcript_82027/g.235662 Transcript_82027/m.235662 type:complete len:213 (-) Transcript_82027:64-702(-)|eukprot:CAMPEP_0177518002 /NCGR_PEP_ID=MMETSP0369-20130122/46283_1 /TAXON_ID=447022 ORGANISM="Scrippsiella hangoei-like, Strain SHHI-4" /NCGR_SAMPLE_ID=MMETSP0369 /ASSEMBLY_ACC=CAM_ASM_000364 /LENGTH=212 /DNA_ID=CAMNT_0018997061 /DNA_START=56 /DNA_END=694 /DNA_ORIENTATION=-